MEHQLLKIIFHADLTANTIISVLDYYQLATNSRLEPLPSPSPSPSIPLNTTPIRTELVRPSTDPVYKFDIPISYCVVFLIYITVLSSLVFHYFLISEIEDYSSDKNDESRLLHPIDPSACSLLTQAQKSEVTTEPPKGQPPVSKETTKKIIPFTASILLNPPTHGNSASDPVPPSSQQIDNRTSSPSQSSSGSALNRKEVSSEPSVHPSQTISRKRRPGIRELKAALMQKSIVQCESTIAPVTPEPVPVARRSCRLSATAIQEKEPSTASLLQCHIADRSSINESKAALNPIGVNQVSHTPSKLRRCGNYYRKRSLWLENASLLPEHMISKSDSNSKFSLKRKEKLKPPEYFQDCIKGDAGSSCFESFNDNDFKAIRTLLKINNDHFKYAFQGCLQGTNIPPNGPVYSSSGRFVLRSFNHQQAFFLHHHVGQFKKHLHNHPTTALSKFIALYRVGPFYYAIEYLTQEEIRYKSSRYLMKWNGELYNGYCLSRIDGTEANEYKSILLQDIRFFEKIKAQFYNLQGGEKEDGSSWYKLCDWVNIISDDGVKAKKNLQIYKKELEFLFE